MNFAEKIQLAEDAYCKLRALGFYKHGLDIFMEYGMLEWIKMFTTSTATTEFKQKSTKKNKETNLSDTSHRLSDLPDVLTILDELIMLMMNMMEAIGYGN